MKLDSIRVPLVCATIAAGLALALATACSSETAGSSRTGSSSTRTPTCLAWQDAQCDYIADRCGSTTQVTRSECDDTFQSLFCKSDGVMLACMDALPGAACGSTPAQCTGVADRQPAIDLCNQFVQKYCAAGVGCQQVDSQQACVTEGSQKVDCSSSIGAAPAIGSCFEVLDHPDCAALKSGLPSVCQGVIKVDTTPMRLGPAAPTNPLRGAIAVVPALVR